MHRDDKHDKHNRIKGPRLKLTTEEIAILKMIKPLITATEERLERDGLQRTKEILNVISPHRLIGRVEVKIHVELPMSETYHVS